MDRSNIPGLGLVPSESITESTTGDAGVCISEDAEFKISADGTEVDDSTGDKSDETTLGPLG